MPLGNSAEIPMRREGSRNAERFEILNFSMLGIVFKFSTIEFFGHNE